MDKDMERLGKERLKRVRRRRQLATFIISMAVIVLGITAYRLIQPASAADQNQRDFTIDNVTENYVNLNILFISSIRGCDTIKTQYLFSKEMKLFYG